jgi:DNA polymerase-4
VLAPELRNEPRALAVLHRLLQKAAMRLRAAEYFAAEICVTVDRQGDAPSWSDHLRLDPTQDTLEFAAMLNILWARRTPLPPGARPMRVGVTLTALEPAADHTPSLFHVTANRRAGLLRAVDKLNLQYGNGAVYWAGAHTARDAAPMRIAFNRVPSLVNETDHERRKGMKKTKNF